MERSTCSRVSTNTLTGTALDWAVAKAAGRKPTLHKTWQQAPGYLTVENGDAQLYWNPTRDWRIAGPIIEREEIDVTCSGSAGWAATGFRKTTFGPTPLIAAMRCYVASKLGDEIDIPEDLS